MPSLLALVLTLLLIVYLLRHDLREEPRVSTAVWIPTLWLMINGSRQVSQWVGSVPLEFNAQTLEEGNAIDKAVYLALMVAGAFTLWRRRVQVGQVLQHNAPIVLFLVYGALSIAWSDFPLTASKRWVKAIGDPLMVLVLWSDPYPLRAVTATIRRCAYVLVPLSILFCKYYENLGRAFDVWGQAFYTGVTTDKNMFGYLLFAFGLFFAAAILSVSEPNGQRRISQRSDQFINIILLTMIVWLLPIANSKTATIALVIGTVVLVAIRSSVTVRKHFLACIVVAVLLVTAAESLFSIKSSFFEASGRDATFTGRTGLWETVLREPINPLLGEGYASFWLGERLLRFWAMYPTSPPIQAHNGYIEIYLNLGLIGLCLIGYVLLRGLYIMRSRVDTFSSTSIPSTYSERAIGLYGLAFGVAYLFYNYTEATFQGLNPLFTIFLILAFDSRHPVSALSRLQSDASAAAWRDQGTGPRYAVRRRDGR